MDTLDNMYIYILYFNSKINKWDTKNVNNVNLYIASKLSSHMVQFLQLQHMHLIQQ